MRNLHRNHCVDPDERGVAAAIRKVGSSTAQGQDRLAVLHLRHLGEHGLAFVTELFNLSVARVGFLEIWKNSVKKGFHETRVASPLVDLEIETFNRFTNSIGTSKWNFRFPKSSINHFRIVLIRLRI